MSESIWKKEIRLRKKPEPLPPLPAHLLERSRGPAERPTGTASVAPTPAERPSIVPFPKPAAVESQDPVSLLPARATVEPAPVAPDLPKPASAYGWTRPAVEQHSPAPAPAVESIAPAGLRAPEQPAARTPEPEPAAAEAPSVEAEKTPLLKREVSFTRRPKPAKPPKAKQEKTPKTGRESTLKREIHLPRPSRKPKAAPGHKVERVIGLHIGSSQLAAAHVLNNGHAEVVQLARRPLERGLVVDGEVRDTVALTRELKDFFSANKLPRKDVRLGIASSRIGVRILEVPSIDDPKQFENAIRFRAQELLPIPVSDAILDHVVLGEHANGEGDVVRRVLLVFAHRDLVNRFVEACRGAGVRLAGVDLDAFALLRAVGAAAAGGEQARAVVAVSIGHERTILAVSDGTICDFTRVLEWGGSSLDVALARALDLTPSQAEPVKHLLSLDAEEAPDGLTPLQLEAAKSALRIEVGVLGRELVSSLRFYQSRPDSLPIGEVLLVGGTAQLGGLTTELQHLLGASVRLADPFARVTVGKRVDVPEATSSLAVAVGLGIES